MAKEENIELDIPHIPDIIYKSNIIYTPNNAYKIIYVHTYDDHIFLFILKIDGDALIFKTSYLDLMSNNDNHQLKNTFTPELLDISMKTNIKDTNIILEYLESSNSRFQVNINDQKDYIHIPIKREVEQTQIRLNLIYENLYQDYEDLQNHRTRYNIWIYSRYFLFFMFVFIVVSLIIFSPVIYKIYF